VIPENQLRAIQKIAQELQDSGNRESCLMAAILFAAASYGFVGGRDLEEFSGAVHGMVLEVRSHWEKKLR
jgi:hypothetical protein